MNILKITFAGLGVLFLLAGITLVVLSFRKEAVKEQMPQESPVFYLKDFQYTQWDTAGKKQARKNYSVGGKLLVMKNKNLGPIQVSLIKEVAMEHPKVKFFDNDQEQARITAQTALPQTAVEKPLDFLQADVVKFVNQAILANRNGRLLMCDALTWNKPQGQFMGKGNCSLQLEDKVIQAPAISVNRSLSTWHFPEAVWEPVF